MSQEKLQFEQERERQLNQLKERQARELTTFDDNTGYTNSFGSSSNNNGHFEFANTAMNESSYSIKDCQPFDQHSSKDKTIDNLRSSSINSTSL